MFKECHHQQLYSYKDMWLTYIWVWHKIANAHWQVLLIKHGYYIYKNFSVPFHRPHFLERKKVGWLILCEHNCLLKQHKSIRMQILCHLCFVVAMCIRNIVCVIPMHGYSLLHLHLVAQLLTMHTCNRENHLIIFLDPCSHNKVRSEDDATVFRHDSMDADHPKLKIHYSLASLRINYSCAIALAIILWYKLYDIFLLIIY